MYLSPHAPPPIVVPDTRSRLEIAASALLWRRSPLVTTMWVLATALLLLGGTLLVYLTGGTAYSFLHVMYLPVGLAALRFGIPGGIVAGLAAGLLVGPIMPFETATPIEQSTSGWLFRTVFYVFNGLLIGLASDLLHRRLEHAERVRAQVSQLYARNLRLFATLVAERDEGTAGHCERVAQNAVSVGRVLGLPKNDLKALYWAGLLHDLGKIGVPEDILRKPGRLTGDEYTVMKRHARLGYEILMTVSSAFEELAEGVYTHHERFDGAGYPRGLKGEDIPIFGRILAVVDVFEAVTSERPYRHPMPEEEALRLLASGSGSQFDPQVFNAFMNARSDGQITRQEHPVPIYDSFVEAMLDEAVKPVDQTLVD